MGKSTVQRIFMIAAEVPRYLLEIDRQIHSGLVDRYVFVAGHRYPSQIAGSGGGGRHRAAEPVPQAGVLPALLKWLTLPLEKDTNHAPVGEPVIVDADQ